MIESELQDLEENPHDLGKIKKIKAFSCQAGAFVRAKCVNAKCILYIRNKSIYSAMKIGCSWTA